MSFFLTLLLSLSTVAQAENLKPCDVYFDWPDVREAILDYQQISSVKSVWSTYDPYNQTLVIFNRTSYSHCVVEITGSTVNKFALKTTFRDPKNNFPYILYQSIRSHGPVNPEMPAEYIELLSSRGIDFAEGIDLNVFREMKMARERQLLGIETGDASYNWIGMIVHEGFHLFVQQASQSSLASAVGLWPTWVLQPVTSEIPDKCYFNTAKKSLIEDEVALLKQALWEAIVTHDQLISKQYIRQYIDARKTRIEALDGVLVSKGRTAIGCAEAEAIMEHEEGLPDFVAKFTALSTGQVSAENYAKLAFAGPSKFQQYYYRFGSVKALLLRFLLPLEFAAISARVANSKTWEYGLQYEIEKMVQEKP